VGDVRSTFEHLSATSHFVIVVVGQSFVVCSLQFELFASRFSLTLETCTSTLIGAGRFSVWARRQLQKYLKVDGRPQIKSCSGVLMISNDDEHDVNHERFTLLLNLLMSCTRAFINILPRIQ